MISPPSYNTQVYAADVAPRRITDKSAISHQMGLWFRGIIPASHYNSDLRGVPGSIPGGSILFLFLLLIVIYVSSFYFITFCFVCRWCWNACYGVDIIMNCVFFRSIGFLFCGFYVKHTWDIYKSCPYIYIVHLCMP